MSGSAPARAELIGMTLIALDYGSRRIGVAIKPAGQSVILPREVLAVREVGQAVERVRALIAETGAQGVVVGLPEHADPAQAREVKRFCRKAREGQSGVRWFFTDESLTSAEARAISLDRAGTRAIDDLAAALILERFLECSRRE